MCCLSSHQAVTPTEAREEVTAHCAHCIPNNTSFKLCLCQAAAPAGRSPSHRCTAGEKIQRQRGQQLSLSALPTQALPSPDIRADTALGSLNHFLLAKRGQEEGTERQKGASSCPLIQQARTKSVFPCVRWSCADTATAHKAGAR